MNMNSQIKPVTTEEYFTIINQDNLKPEEVIQKESFEKYIQLCKQYESYISPAAQSILNDYNSRIMAMSTKENKTIHEENILKDFQDSFTPANSIEQQGPIRKLAQDGYIDASIILTIILNVGFIIALAILGR